MEIRYKCGLCKTRRNRQLSAIVLRGKRVSHLSHLPRGSREFHGEVVPVSRDAHIRGKIMKTLWSMYWILFVGLLVGVDAAYARDFYCRHSGLRTIHDGGEFDENWEVVNSSVRRVQMPSQTKPTTGCHISWRSVGGFYRSPEIIEGPRLGSARVVSNYRISYQSARNGQDRVTTRIHWLSSSGKPQSAIVRYNITVTDRPL